jgi:hypothetical protein
MSQVGRLDLAIDDVFAVLHREVGGGAHGRDLPHRTTLHSAGP